MARCWANSSSMRCRSGLAGLVVLQDSFPAHCAGSMLSGGEFDRAEPIFVVRVAVLCFERERMVRVAFPAAAPIERIVDSADRIFATESNDDGVVFAPADVREADLAERGHVERPRGSQAMDAERIVVAVFGRPLAMIDEARRNLLQAKVDDRVRADYRGATAATKLGDDAREDIGAGVYVVAIELHGVAAALRCVDRFVPAAADAEIVAGRNDVDQPIIFRGEVAESVGRTVGRVIVDDDDVEWKIGLLFKRAVYRIANGLHAIADGDDHAAFNGERRIVVGRTRGRRRQPGLDALEVGCRDLFHFNLIAAVSRIDVTEMCFFIGELDGGRGEIGGLAEVDDGTALAKPQAEVVPAAEVGGSFLLFDRIGESADALRG